MLTWVGDAGDGHLSPFVVVTVHTHRHPWVDWCWGS
jgi:hypothetical protein